MTTIHQGNERLLRLAQFLDTLEPKQFDIRLYVSMCNTVCCAIGWCPKVFAEWEYQIPCGEMPRLKNSDCGSNAAQCGTEFFALTISEFWDLFMSIGYRLPSDQIGPHHVARQIREFVLKRLETPMQLDLVEHSTEHLA